ncbi:hypothetical protein NP493_136g01000 [Ridgeia piscesae]|uniref:Uncharacterized protein n=1 Tax=Ridgeia piscesae TaxID=27915 RepID=A0AAD9P526_RIDPI|nr:hypothetical protein NP493_136g01000 [Ridgeia piscesae]
MRCPVHRRFFLIRRSSIDGNPVRLSMSLFVTLSIQVILIHADASDPYRRVDSTIARYILPLTHMATWCLFLSL